MKKIILSFSGLSLSAFAFAQATKDSIPLPPQPNFNREVMESVNNINYIEAIMPIFAIAPIVLLTIYLTKFILDHRLRNKIIDRGISEQLAASILEKNEANRKDESIKWALLFMGLGTGLLIAYYTKPFDIHSLAIMAFSLAASYLGYFFYQKKQKQ